MKKIQISLISQQSIPNLKLIKEFQTEVDNHIFITTKEMEDDNKSDDIINAANLSQSKVQKIRVNPNALSDIENELLKIEERKGYEYIVNITGGTKLMSIAALNYFDEFKNVKIFYVPIEGECFRQIFPRIENPETKFKIKISIYEYLTSYGLEIITKSNEIRNFEISRILMRKLINGNSCVKEIPTLRYATKHENPEDRTYFMGKWFEEYIYQTIKNKLSLNNSEIATSVKIKKGNSENEFDVLFIYKNQIYVIECKAYYSARNVKFKLQEAMYKLGALDDDFGLQAHSFLITTFDIKNYKPQWDNTLNNRAKSLDVRFLQFNDIKNSNKIINQILK